MFVNPAYHEPFGITIIEAAATGIPVVATNNGGPVEILTNCKCGILVEPRDTVAIADSCKNILSNLDLWDKYSKNGVLKTNELYSWESTARKELKIFQDVIAAKI